MSSNSSLDFSFGNTFFFLIQPTTPQQSAMSAETPRGKKGILSRVHNSSFRLIDTSSSQSTMTITSVWERKKEKKKACSPLTTAWVVNACPRSKAIKMATSEYCLLSHYLLLRGLTTPASSHAHTICTTPQTTLAA
jgi:hypothetical protein